MSPSMRTERAELDGLPPAKCLNLQCGVSADRPADQIPAGPRHRYHVEPVAVPTLARRRRDHWVWQLGLSALPPEFDRCCNAKTWSISCRRSALGGGAMSANEYIP